MDIIRIVKNLYDKVFKAHKCSLVCILKIMSKIMYCSASSTSLFFLSRACIIHRMIEVYGNIAVVEIIYLNDIYLLN